MINSRCVPIARKVMDEISLTPTTQPVYAFGMHKGGSTMLADFLQIYSKIVNLNAISISNVLFHHGIDDETYRTDRSLGDLLHDKFLYYGFRYVPEFILSNKAKFINRKAIILVRDPRDCVVSAYFSFLKSHVVTADKNSDVFKQIEKERIENQATSIDQYAVEQISRFVDELCGYAYFMHENARLFRYEDVIFEKRAFFSEVLEHLNLPWDQRAFDTALNRVDIQPDREDKDKHIRNVKPGNHREKLSPAVIEELNVRYESVLSLFGYQ